jgi:pimeloyl-ACP methyl ester carboxylesterase
MRLHAEEIGNGEPLVLLHGIGSAARAWRPVMPLLAERHHVIAIDLPGFADSAPLPAGREASIPAMAGAVEDELDARGIAGAHLAGNSMGGWVSLELAKGDRALSVTAISPGGLSTPAEQRKALVNLYASHYLAKSIAPVADGFTRIRPLWRIGGWRMFARPQNLDPVEAAHSIRAFASAAAFRSAERWMTKHEWEGMDAITCAVTVLWGTKDRLLPVRQATRVKRHIPLAEVIEMPGLGHVPMSDDPRAIAEAILRGAARQAAL